MFFSPSNLMYEISPNTEALRLKYLKHFVSMEKLKINFERKSFDMVEKNGVLSINKIKQVKIGGF